MSLKINYIKRTIIAAAIILAVVRQQHKEEIDFSSSLPEVWRVLTEKEREILRSNASIQNFKRNSLIYCEGDEPTDMMCLLKGKVKIYKDGVGLFSEIQGLCRVYCCKGK